MHLFKAGSLPMALCLMAARPGTAADDAEPPDLPATIRVGLVFPRNETYNVDPTVMPVVMTIENAEPAFWFGFNIAWDIYRLNETGHPIGGSEFGYTNHNWDKAPLPPDAINGNFVVGNSSWFPSETERGPGRYRLTWEFSMTYCTLEPPNRLVIQGSGPHMNGTVDFTVSNTTGLAVNLTSECPEYQGSLHIRASSLSCPLLSAAYEPDDVPDLCHLRLDQTMADCVLANITKNEDRSACEELLERARDQGDGGGNNQGDEGGNNQGNSDGEDNEASSPFFWGLSATITTVVILSGILELGL